MFLTAANLAHYLLDSGLIDVADIVDGDFKVIEAGQNNRNFKVVVGNNRGKFLKQVQSFQDLHRSSIQREADCYRWAQGFPLWANLMPTLVRYDQSRYCLILELLSASENLREFYNKQREFPESIACLLGGALSVYHSIKIDLDSTETNLPKLSNKVPWIFTYHKVSYFPANSLSGGAVQFGDVLRSLPTLQTHLERLFDIWRSSDLIHADIKWDNCLIQQVEHEQRLKIIDWELVQMGDARWDIGSVFQSYLSFWVMCSYRDSSLSTQQLIDDTVANMPKMFASIRAFWNNYSTARNEGSTENDVCLKTCLEFAAVRMLQTAFESLYHCSEMSPHAYALLDLSQQVLRDPAQAAVDLFGLTEDVR
jgi:5-methylthioribose kinase